MTDRWTKCCSHTVTNYRRHVASLVKLLMFPPSGLRGDIVADGRTDGRTKAFTVIHTICEYTCLWTRNSIYPNWIVCMRNPILLV